MPEGVDVLAADDALAGRHGKVHVGVHILGIDIPIGADELPVQDAHVIVLHHGVRVGEVEDEGLLRVFGRRERIDRVLGHVDGIVPARRTTRRAPGALEGYFDKLRGDAVLIDDRDAVDDGRATGWRVEHGARKRIAPLELIGARIDNVQRAILANRRLDGVARALVALGMRARGHDAHAHGEPDCTCDDQRQDKTRRGSFVWFRDVRQIGQVRLSHLASRMRQTYLSNLSHVTHTHHEKLTCGAVEAAASASKSSRSLKPNMPAKMTAGKVWMPLLYFMTVSL